MTDAKGAGATGAAGAARGQHVGSTGAAKCPFHETDFQAISIHINILNPNEI